MAAGLHRQVSIPGLAPLHREARQRCKESSDSSEAAPSYAKPCPAMPSHAGAQSCLLGLREAREKVPQPCMLPTVIRVQHRKGRVGKRAAQTTLGGSARGGTAWPTSDSFAILDCAVLTERVPRWYGGGMDGLACRTSTTNVHCRAQFKNATAGQGLHKNYSCFDLRPPRQITRACARAATGACATHF